MIHVAQTVTVNGGSGPRLDVEQVWHGLVLKAEDPTRFVRGITACRILERLPDGLVREVDLHGETVRERILYREPECVTFVRLNGTELGFIRNEILRDDAGGLALRFTFDLEVAGLASGSAEEKAHAAHMTENYLAAVESTLARIRELVREGSVAA